MKTLMIIETTYGGLIFSLSFLTAFLVAAGIMIFHGSKKGYPMASWLLILITGVIFFIIGEKIFTYAPAQWAQVFGSFHLPAAIEKNAWGGIMGLLAGLALAKTLLRFHRSVSDSLAIALPLSLAISRIGCLMAGCCFGIPTTLPLGIRYDAGSIAYQLQQAHGLIDVHAPGSLPVHPVQLYQVVGGLLIALVVWTTRRHWKAGGSLFLFSILCYGFLRFFVEFLVDPSSNTVAGRFLWGMNLVQWMILAAFLPATIGLFMRESKAKSVSKIVNPSGISEPRQVLLAAFLSLLVYTGRHWFDPLELSAILLFFIPVIIILAVELYLHHSPAGRRWVLPFFLVCCTSFMAQKSTPTGKEKLIFTDVGLIGIAGRYYEDVSRVTKTWIPDSGGGGGCYKSTTDGGYYITEWRPAGTSKVGLWQTGIDVSHNKWVGKYYKFSIGARGYLGTETETIRTDHPSSTYAGISPYLSFGWRHIGFGCGFTVGQMKVPYGNYDVNSFSEGTFVATGYRNMYFMPSFSFRAGPVDIIYAEASFPGMFPSMTPYPVARAGLGSGLGKTNGTKVAVGYCDGIYAQFVYPIREKVVLEALYADNLRSGTSTARMFSVGVHYRIPSAKNTLQDNYPAAGSAAFLQPGNTVTDIDGNVYRTLVLGSRLWMAENLSVTHFRDGSEIPGITENTGESALQYTWFAAGDSNRLCPSGLHVPIAAEWNDLFNSLGGQNGALDKLKENFAPDDRISQWWSSTTIDNETSQSMYLNPMTEVVIFAGMNKRAGLAVRCIRDN